jgi:rhodanese-related sulfurtransferase
MIDQVRPSALHAWLQAQQAATGKLPLVLDVREPWELQTSAIQAGGGFELAAIPMNAIPARAAELDAQRPVAVLCHHGGRSQRVAMFLAQQGFANLANIAGGIDAWSQELDAGVPRY